MPLAFTIGLALVLSKPSSTALLGQSVKSRSHSDGAAKGANRAEREVKPGSQHASGGRSKDDGGADGSVATMEAVATGYVNA